MLFQCILVFTGLNYDGNKYADYRFPGWANLLGWLLTFSSVAVVPAVAVRKIIQDSVLHSHWSRSRLGSH